MVAAATHLLFLAFRSTLQLQAADPDQAPLLHRITLRLHGLQGNVPEALESVDALKAAGAPVPSKEMVELVTSLLRAGSTSEALTLFKDNCADLKGAAQCVFARKEDVEEEEEEEEEDDDDDDDLIKKKPKKEMMMMMMMMIKKKKKKKKKDDEGFDWFINYSF